MANRVACGWCRWRCSGSPSWWCRRATRPRRSCPTRVCHHCVQQGLRHQPRSVYVKLTDCDIEFLPPRPCRLHTQTGADKTCPACDFLPGVLAVKPCTNQQAWSVNITCITDGNGRDVRGCRTQLPLVCLKASTLHVLQGTTTDPGLIFHWAFDCTWHLAHINCVPKERWDDEDSDATPSQSDCD